MEDRTSGLEGEEFGHLLPRGAEVSGALGEAGDLLEDWIPGLVGPRLLARLVKGLGELAGVPTGREGGAEDQGGIRRAVAGHQLLRVLSSLSHQTPGSLLLASELDGREQLIDRAARRAQLGPGFVELTFR